MKKRSIMIFLLAFIPSILLTANGFRQGGRMHGPGGGAWVGFILGLIFFCLLIAIMILVIIRLAKTMNSRHGRPQHAHKEAQKYLDNIVRELYARGEITAEEMRERLARLKETKPVNSKAEITADKS